eukprot:3067691-Prymnesium_polylepis.1
MPRLDAWFTHALGSYLSVERCRSDCRRSTPSLRVIAAGRLHSHEGASPSCRPSLVHAQIGMSVQNVCYNVIESARSLGGRTGERARSGRAGGRGRAVCPGGWRLQVWN